MIKHLFYIVYVFNKKVKFDLLANNQETKAFFTFEATSYELINRSFEEYDAIAVKFQIKNSFIR